MKQLVFCVVLALFQTASGKHHFRHHRLHGNVPVPTTATNYPFQNDIPARRSPMNNEAVTASDGKLTSAGDVVTVDDLERMMMGPSFNPRTSAAVISNPVLATMQAKAPLDTTSMNSDSRNVVNNWPSNLPPVDMEREIESIGRNASAQDSLSVGLEVDMTGAVPPERTSEIQRLSSAQQYPALNGSENPGGSNSGILYQFVDMGPYLNHRKYSVRFLLAMTGYFMTGLLALISVTCLARKIRTRRCKHAQYQLLSQRDFEFPLGGGGI